MPFEQAATSKPLSTWLLILIGCLLTSAGPGQAQRFGQWWWQASAKIEQRETENLQDDSRLSRFGQSGLRLDGELNGFIVHPTVASFRIGLEALLTDFVDGRLDASETLGGRLELSLLPRGKYPIRLHAARTSFDYTVPEGADPVLALVRDPGEETRWGGLLQARRGPFRGLRLSTSSVRTSFLDPAARKGRFDLTSVTWSRSIGRTRHSLRLTSRRHGFGIQDLDRDDLTAYLDQQGPIGKRWNWQVNGSGFRSSIDTSTVQREVDNYRVRGKIFGTVRGVDRFELTAETETTRLDSADPVDSYGVLARYRWQKSARLQIGPFLRQVRQSVADEGLNSSRLGLFVIWSGRSPRFDTVLTANSSYGTLDQVEQGRESSVDLSLTGTFAHGDVGRLRKELELFWARNELDTTSSRTNPDGNRALVRSIGEQDQARARLTLTRRLDSRSKTLWLDWSRREARDALFGGDFTADTLSATATRSSTRFRLQAAGGRSDVQRGTRPDETLTFANASIGWRPTSALDIQALYRFDDRSSAFVPDLDGEVLELRLTFRLGLLEIEGRAFESERQVAGGQARVNRGFNWSIRRRFAGLLPIISAPQRRGVIR